MKSRKRIRSRSKYAASVEPERGKKDDVRRSHHEIVTRLPAKALADRIPTDASRDDRDRVEAELRRLSAIVKNASDAVIIQTFEGEILAWNRGAEFMYGYREEEAVGMKVGDIIPARLHRKADKMRERILSGEPVEPFETRRVARDGRTVDVWVSVTTLVDACGRPEAIATTERDITTIKEAEETIRVQQIEIAHIGRVHAMGEFAAAMAHELNQPLCAIGANARALRRMIDDSESRGEVRDALSDIVQDVERASKVVEGMRAQLRKCEPEYKPLDINEVVREISPIAEALARSSNKSVSFVYGDGLPAVQGDRTQLQQVLLNLIRNGLEAMADPKPDLRVLEIRTSKSSERDVLVTVRDHGHGIQEAAAADKIFEPFFTTKETGMGMGLAICDSIIGAHRGRLWATNNSDTGCTLHFSLPCSPESVQS